MIDLQFALIAIGLFIFVIASNMGCFWLGVKSQHVGPAPVEIPPPDEEFVTPDEKEVDQWAVE